MTILIEKEHFRLEIEDTSIQHLKGGVGIRRSGPAGQLRLTVLDPSNPHVPALQLYLSDNLAQGMGGTNPSGHLDVFYTGEGRVRDSDSVVPPDRERQQFHGDLIDRIGMPVTQRNLFHGYTSWGSLPPILDELQKQKMLSHDNAKLIKRAVHAADLGMLTLPEPQQRLLASLIETPGVLRETQRGGFSRG